MGLAATISPHTDNLLRPEIGNGSTGFPDYEGAAGYVPGVGTVFEKPSKTVPQAT